MRTQSKTGDLLEARENASDQMVLVFLFDWLRWWRQVSGPITERSEEKPKSNPVSVAALRRIAQDRSNLLVSASQPSRLAGRQIGKNLRKRHKRNWRRNFWRSRQRTVRLTRGTHWMWSKEDWHNYRRPFWVRWRENTLQNKRYFSLTVTWVIKDPCFLLSGGVHKQTHLGIVSKKPPAYCSWVWEQKSEPRLSDVKLKPK